ncbi:PAS domain-containing hybrid sensor histidine kinase/response regulator [Brevifollis gellanilyticus]|uniref:histidine kinase n=1 Tax=Brevifollis gellanilyticus TaxID=748831 RepID=A0A512MEE1_9BACT|nr:PAS domain-containing hybrid sensor histidine kinase/response regulator [Brevifollis gellanilyticus]GEP45062.1 hypothetical protein BGE01nite_43530 [Brevifollis gellanilyticus]
MKDLALSWKTTSRILGLTAAGIGLLGFLGWVLQVDVLKRVHPAWVTMKANTGLCLMLAGMAVALLHDEQLSHARRRVSQVFAVIIAMVGLLTLGEHFEWWHTPLDQWLFHETVPEAGRSFPGRMGPASAANFMLLGLALLLIDRKPGQLWWPAQICALAVMALTFLISLTYFYAFDVPLALAKYLSIAPHTVVAFMMLSTAILFARPERGFMAVICADNTGGIIARRLLPAALIWPTFIGWLCTLGHLAGYLGRGLDTALLASSLTLIFTGLVWWAARALGSAAERRRRAEDKLRRSEHELSDFFDNAAIALHWMGPDGCVLRVNDKELSMLGYSREEYLGRHIKDFHADPKVSADILARLTLGEILTDYPARMRCKDGSMRDVLIHSSVYWENGKFIHTRCFTRDVTERLRDAAALAQARDVAEAANRAKDDFLAVLSHELRTPLMPALATVSDLESELPQDPAELRQELSVIRRNIELEARLVDDLLDVTRINHGKLRIHAAPVNLHTALTHALTIAGPMLREKNISVVSDLAAQDRFVRGDAARLAQIFSNLLTNAAKFTPKAGKVEVHSMNEGNVIKVVVSDTGIGIDAAMLPRIFEAFHQGGISATRQFGGLGLGLSVAKSLVESHGGSLKAYSGGLGRGATFVVILPVQETPAADITATPPADAPPASVIRIMLVEDHEDTRRILQRLLERWGHHVTVAGNVADARRAITSGEFDLLLSDFGLPDGTGLDVIAALREKSTIPAVAMSGYGMDADLARTRAAGFSEHLVKPITADVLKQLVSRYAAARKSQELV